METNNYSNISIDYVLNNLLETAKQDLNVSKELYKKGYYAPSLFYLQQGLEKLNKYLYGRIMYPSMSISKLEKLFMELGHNFTKNIQKTLSNSLKQLKRYTNKNSDVYTELESYLRQFNEKLMSVAKAQVDFSALKGSLNSVETFSSCGMNLISSELNQIEPILKKSNYNLNIDLVYLTNNIKSILKAFYIQFFFDRYDLISMVRYPTKSNKYTSPYKYYNKDNEFVKEFKYIHEQISKILKDIEK
jgi:HEPN domain-containing protein